MLRSVHPVSLLMQGLGKSLTTIAFLHMFFKYTKSGCALLVVPANVSCNKCYGMYVRICIHYAA